MAYYDSRPPYPPADYPEPPSYSYSGSAHGGSHATDVMPHSNSTAGGSRDAYYRNHPARDAYEYSYDDHPSDSKRSRKGRHRASTTSAYHDDPYDEYEPRSRRSRHYDERRGRDYSPSISRSPPRRRRSLSERALGALGLGAAAGAGAKASHGSDRGRSRGRHHRSYSYSPSPARGSHRHRGKSEARIAQAVKAAVTAGAVEAFRARKEPGEWSGPKGKRVLTAALGAGATDGLVDRNPDKHSKRHVLESTLAGLATNHLVNGSRSRSRSHHRRNRSRSRSRGGKGKELAMLGVLAAAGKEAYDRYQKSHSRSRPRHRSDSRDSYDSYDSRPRPKRSKSVSDYINKGIAALGLDDKSDRSDRDDRRRRHHRSSRHDDYSDSDDDYYRRHPSPPRSRHSRDVSRPYYIPAAAAAAGARSIEGGYDHDRSAVGYHSRPGSRSLVNERPRDYSRQREKEREKGREIERQKQKEDKENDSDANDSTDDRKKLKKLNRETLWATTLAAAASVHAAHSLTENMEQHKERSKKLKEGEISREEARRQKRKNQFSDAASLGVAALSIKSAVAEWQHLNEKRHERANLHKICKERSKSLNKGNGSRSSRDNPRNSHSNAKHHSSRPQRTQSLSQRPPRTMYPDEIEEIYSVAGRSPGVMV
ncbi:hypothetical protein BDW69DRAFT_167871 [Aspergillus filifer]